MIIIEISAENVIPYSAAGYKIEFKNPLELIQWLCNINNQLTQNYNMRFLSDYEPALKGIIK